MEMENKKYNRCSGFTKSGKKCRAKIEEENKFYCCKDHEPFNIEIHSEGCFMCTDNITSSKELIQFKCKHAVHRCCFNEWIKFSNYNKPICLICREEINKDDNNIFLNNFEIMKTKNKVKIKNIHNPNIYHYLYLK